MSFEAITTISDAENRARQIKADAQAAAAAAVEAAQAEGKAVIEAAGAADAAGQIG
jgi:Na+-transporting methylmalonyl-CoA/oxaloacetate decarboxylase gamma subunit